MNKYLFVLSSVFFSVSLFAATCPENQSDFIDGAARSFRSHALAITQYTPVLHRNVDKCFNQASPNYISGMHGLLEKVEQLFGVEVGALDGSLALYKKTMMGIVSRSTAAVAGGVNQQQATEVNMSQKAMVGQSTAAFRAKILNLQNEFQKQYNFAGKSTTIRNVINDSRLGSYGFTKSEKPGYPECNSRNNEQPEGNWAGFKQQFNAALADLDNAKFGIECQMRMFGVGF